MGKMVRENFSFLHTVPGHLTNNLSFLTKFFLREKNKKTNLKSRIPLKCLCVHMILNSFNLY